MYLSIDLGGSTVDVISFQNNGIKKIISFESKKVNKNDLESIIRRAKISLRNIKTITLTGGHNRKYSNTIKNIPLVKINEIQAIGTGGASLTNLKNALIISMGTGTCLVSMKNGRYQHVGGTGLGGGTLVGLGNLLLNEKNALKIQQLAIDGNLSSVDLSVKDIVGDGIGIIPGFATASNFGKLRNYKKKDLALGICNLIGQTIGSMANFAANTHGHKNIILAGKLIRIKKIVDIIKKTAKLYNRTILVPKNAEYISAIGAMSCFLKQICDKK